VIPELREKKGLTQEELAFKAKVTSGYVAQLELGIRKNPSQPLRGLPFRPCPCLRTDLSNLALL
jgi:transcriptional regulator with XRE-family HTH domain